jgi:ABC-type glycerol-3-phosphate transport system substrate-binding protein
MQRALEELVAASKCGLPEQLQYGPAEVRTAFWQGRCGMALTWPSAATAGTVPIFGQRREASARKWDCPPPAPGEPGTGNLPAKGEKPGGIQIGFVELPGSPEVYDRSMPGLRFANRAPLDDPHVPLLTVAGRIGVVARESSQAEAARELLLWLSGDQMSPLVSAASPATTLFRRSHLKSPELWVEPAIPRLAAEQYATTTEQTLRREQWVCALRIPGRAEYLAALDDAVQRAIQGKQAPIEALYQAAKRWQEITEKKGVQQQRQAYRHSLGLD